MPTARELGIGFLAYSPLGRGILTGQLQELASLPETDMRRLHNPRFQGESFQKARMAPGSGSAPSAAAHPCQCSTHCHVTLTTAM